MDSREEKTNLEPVPSFAQSVKHADAALQAVAGLEGEVLVLDEATNKRLLRKIDWNLMPMLCVIYGLQYLDKTSLSYASIMGLKTDIHLDPNSTEYSWLGSIFYFGYIIWEYPTNGLLQRLPLAKYTAINIIIWGGVLCCLAATKNFGGALAVRFLLGLFESGVTPGFAYFTSQWYTKREQGSRTAIWYSFNGFAQILGGLVAYGIAKGTRLHGSSIEPWKIVFLLTGLLTMTVGVVFLFVMPDNQLNARFLNKNDRILAIERIRINQQGVGNKEFKLYQLKQALLDPITWAIACYALIADIPNGGITNFFSSLIVSFGYSNEESLLYGTPAGAVEVVALLFCGWLGDRLQRRVLVSSLGLITAIIGMILIVALPLSNNVGRLIGYYLLLASPTPFVALLSLISTNIAGYTRKTTVAAIYLIFYCAGNIIGPQMFRAKDSPRYVPAEIAIIVCWAVCLFDLYFIHWWWQHQNKKKEAQRTAPGYQKVPNQEFLDLTDRENPEFVYSL